MSNQVPVADDFAEINRRLKEIEAENSGKAPKKEDKPGVPPAEQEGYAGDVFW